MLILNKVYDCDIKRQIWFVWALNGISFITNWDLNEPHLLICGFTLIPCIMNNSFSFWKFYKFTFKSEVFYSTINLYANARRKMPYKCNQPKCSQLWIVVDCTRAFNNRFNDFIIVIVYYQYFSLILFSIAVSHTLCSNAKSTQMTIKAVVWVYFDWKI